MNRKATLGFMGRWLQRLYAQISAASVLLLLSEGFKLAVPVAAGVAVFDIVRGASANNSLLLLAIVTALAIALNELGLWLSHALAFRLLATLRVEFFRKLDALGPGYLQRRRSGDLTGIATDDMERLEGFYAHWLPQLFVALALPVLALAALAWVDVTLMVVVAVFAVAAGAVLFFASGKRQEYDGVQEQLAALGAYAVETLQGLRELTAFQYQDEWLTRGRAHLNEYHRRILHYLHVHYLRGKAAVDILAGLGMVAFLIVAQSRVLEGALDASLLPAALVLAIAALTPAQELAYQLLLLTQAFTSAARVATVMDERVTLTDGAQTLSRKLLEESDAPIRFQDVTFQYDYSKGAALQNISFEAPRGGTLALVGPSGAGKTTLAHLLLRFWDVEAGHIFLAGQDVRAFRLNDLRQNIALVAQDTFLFTGSIRENLLLAKPNATETELRAAIALAGLTEFIAALPQGLETTVGERGAQLSGGERQRIAIARALLKDAPILILDEATSSVDAANEAAIQEALERLTKNRTTLVIAHRLSTVIHADKIIVMENGRAVETGKHGELLARRAAYAQLVAAQAGA